MTAPLLLGCFVKNIKDEFSFLNLESEPGKKAVANFILSDPTKVVKFNKAAFPKDYQGYFYVLQEFDKKRQVCPLLKVGVADMTCSEIY